MATVAYINEPTVKDRHTSVQSGLNGHTPTMDVNRVMSVAKDERVDRRQFFFAKQYLTLPKCNAYSLITSFID